MSDQLQASKPIQDISSLTNYNSNQFNQTMDNNYTAKIDQLVPKAINQEQQEVLTKIPIDQEQ